MNNLFRAPKTSHYIYNVKGKDIFNNTNRPKEMQSIVKSISKNKIEN